MFDEADRAKGKAFGTGNLVQMDEHTIAPRDESNVFSLRRHPG
jgi:hypothetical protein